MYWGTKKGVAGSLKGDKIRKALEDDVCLSLAIFPDETRPTTRPLGVR